MARQAFWGLNTSTWVTGTAHWVATRPYVGISYQSSNAFLQFSGSTTATEAHQSVRFRVSTASMPSDANTATSAYSSLDLRNNGSTSTGSFSDTDTLYVKCLFYSSSVGTGNYDSYSATLTKSGNNTTTGTLIYRPTHELHIWDGSAWRRFDTQVNVPTLDTAFGNVVFPFEWTFTYTLDIAAPTGWQISVKTYPGGLEVGPFSVAGLTTDTITIYTDDAATYEAQLLDDTSTPSGGSIIFTPLI
jgi:hypothetical protein